MTSTLGWSDDKRRASLKLSDLRQREAQLADEKSRIRGDYGNALAFRDDAKARELSVAFGQVLSAWRAAMNERITAEQEFKKCR